jgi:hypothetical protein
MPGIRIAHSQARSSVVLVPIMAKPFSGQSLDRCPTCHLVHPVKTVHLLFDAAGTCIVSAGVLKDLRAAGMPGLTVMAEVLKPPPLRLSAGVTREQVDYSNRKIVRLGQPVHT